MIAVDSSVAGWLSRQPEYRMGYQRGVVTLNSGGVETGIIVNSHIFLKEDEYPWDMRMDWSYAFQEAQKSQLKVKEVRLIQREPSSLKGVRQIVLAKEKFQVLANRKSIEALYSTGERRERLLSESNQLLAKAESEAAKDAPITLTSGGEQFKRFSAYANDFRITPGKGLTAGTFATTKEDADAHVKTGADAVSRYALPNSKPATNVFSISAPIDSEVRRGTAQPANNQPGGGVEVIFVQGLPDGTVSGPASIPVK